MYNNLLNLYSNPVCPDCHSVRLLAAEKEDLVDIIDVHPFDLPESLLAINSYGNLPTLNDRDVVLYDAQVIMEYIDERFPNPVLLPNDPIQRARIRMMLAEIRNVWKQHIDILEDFTSSPKAKRQAADELRTLLLHLKKVLKRSEYFISDEYTLIDITLAPILWRLEKYEIDTSSFGVEFDLYVKRIFDRPAFRRSLSIFEENMRTIPVKS